MAEAKGMRHGFSALLLLFLVAVCPPSSSMAAINTDAAASTVQSMVQDVEDVLGRSFDYIVVGGGTCGCPLAATLSQRYSVLLVERGGSPYGNPLIEERLKYDFANIEADEFASVSQKSLSEEGIDIVRGRVLGGTSAINGGFHSRGREEDIARAGWDPELVREAYEWVESRIIFPVPISGWQFALVGGMVEAGLGPLNGFSLEHLKGAKLGGGIFDAHLRRHSAADLLAAGSPNNLTILLNATVQNVIFRDDDDAGAGSGKRPRARGVRFFRSNGDPSKLYEVYLNDPTVSGSWGDVILSAGTLGSPQILMLSGIGPKEHLAQFSIASLIDATEVGRSIQDNPTISYALNYSSAALPQLHPDPPQVAGIENDFRIIMETIMTYSSFNSSIRVLLLGKVARPVSRGLLRLRSADPRQSPMVRFNYLAEAADLDECVRIVHLIDRVARSRPITEFLRKRQSVLTKDGRRSKEALRDFCKRKVNSMYHYHGGCAVGSVVDRDYRVLGVEGLRVIDLSTFLDVIGTNPMATVLMLGRYQGVKILRERMAESRGIVHKNPNMNLDLVTEN